MSIRNLGKARERQQILIEGEKIIVPKKEQIWVEA